VFCRDDVYYESQFTITGVLQEEPIVMTIKGRGSYDEKHQDLLNLVVESEITTGEPTD